MRTLPVSKAATELGLEESLILALLRLCSGRGGPLIHVMALLLGLSVKPHGSHGLPDHALQSNTALLFEGLRLQTAV